VVDRDFLLAARKNDILFRTGQPTAPSRVHAAAGVAMEV
jgi:hypothetical protein